MQTYSRRWPWLIAVVLGAFGTLYGLAGIVMAGSMGLGTAWPAPPGHEAHWRLVGERYLALTLVALVVVLGSVVVLWRRRAPVVRSTSREPAR